MTRFKGATFRRPNWLIALPLLGLASACDNTSEPPTQTVTAGTGGGGTNASGGGGTAGALAGGAGAAVGGSQSGGAGGSGGAAGASGASASGAGGSGGVAGGSAGAAGSGGAGGSAGAGGSGGGGGSAGAAGSAGSAGASTGACTPGAGPGDGKLFPTAGWRAQWNVPCDFTTNGGCDGVKPPEKAFDGLGTTRTSIGDTHIKAGGQTAQVIGDAFTFDMKTCNKIGKLIMFAAAPPSNSGSFDARDFPGSVKVTVSSDCMTSDAGVITGRFGDVVATGGEAKPGCQNDCNTPMTINITPPVAAKCVKLELTKVLQLGGGIWWAIDELQTYP